MGKKKKAKKQNDALHSSTPVNETLNAVSTTEEFPPIDQAPAIEQEIKEMPNYFSDYDTTVNFISEAEFAKNHQGMPHGGFVIRSGESGVGDKQILEFSLKLDSNPMFTSSVLVAYARAAHKLRAKGEKGAKTVFDIPFGYLSPKSPADLRKELL